MSLGWLKWLFGKPEIRGIVFERGAGSAFETLEVSDDASIERASYRNGKLTSRERLL